MKDYYYILGIERLATTEQIKHAYRKLSIKFHPDKNDGDKFFEERFKEIQEAYETLSNAIRKQAYDNKINSSNFKNNTQSNSSFEDKLKKDFEDELRRRKSEYHEELSRKEKKHQEEIENLKKQIKQKAVSGNLAFSLSKQRVVIALFFLATAIASIYLISFCSKSTEPVKLDSTATIATIVQNSPVSTLNAREYSSSLEDSQGNGDSIKLADVVENNNSQQIPSGVFKISSGYDCAIEFGELRIGELVNDKFSFKIDVSNNKGYSGSVSGLARITEKNVAVFSDDKKCIVTFFFRGNNTIEIQESGSGYYHGANICFSGIYELNDTTHIENLNAQLEKSSEYQKYCNSRYSYCIEYPDNLTPQPVAANSDGRKFVDKLGHEVLTVYGTHHEDANGAQENLQTVYRSELIKKSSSRIITYSKLGATFYIVSGMINGKIFYQKTIQLSDGFGYAILEYSENEKSYYDVVSKHLNNTFRSVP